MSKHTDKIISLRKQMLNPKHYTVTLTMIHNKTVDVEAENNEEAVEYVKNNLEQFAQKDSFTFGEITVDYAEEV